MQDGGRPHNTVQKPETSLPRGPLVTSSPVESFRLGIGFWSTDFFLYVLNEEAQTVLSYFSRFHVYDGTGSLSDHCPVLCPGLNFVLSMVSLC